MPVRNENRSKNGDRLKGSLTEKTVLRGEEGPDIGERTL